MNKFYYLFIFLFILASCTNNNKRNPASSGLLDADSIARMYSLSNEKYKEEDKLRRTYRLKVNHEKETFERDKLTKKYKNTVSKIKNLEEENTEIKKSLQIEKSGSAPFPEYFRLHFNESNRLFSSTVVFSNMDLYKETKNGLFVHPVDIHSAKKYTMTLRQHLIPRSRRIGRDKKRSSPKLSAKLVCDGPFELKTFLFTHEYKGGDEVEFNWYQSQSNGQRVKLSMTKESGSCYLKFASSEKARKKYTHGVQFVPEIDYVSEAVKPFYNSFEFCKVPGAKFMSPLQKTYLNTDIRSMTCPKDISEITTLENTIDGMNAKVKALLGTEMPKKMIEGRDPYYPLDFSNAPKLDAIFISYLVFRNDFYGGVLHRLLKHHAKQGATIKILVSDVIALDKDRAALNSLAEKYPNVMVRYYKFESIAGKETLNEAISQLHRTFHVKMFVTYSKDDEDASTVVLGGRNIHDGFVFKTAPDLSKYPNLVQYGDGKDDGFARWTDFEILLKGQELVETFVGQYLTLFEYDSDDYFFRSYTLNQETTMQVSPEFFESDTPMFRHFVSVPFKDNMELERTIIKYFDSAQSRIQLSTPYFNLTEKLTNALSRAISRGVKVELITRLDLKGDTADQLLSDVNKKTVNKFVDNIVIYEYTNPADILHSKLVLIDGKITFVGSINFNQRSFYHDVENTSIIYSPEFHDKIRNIIEGYKKKARLIETKQKTTWWKTLIIGALQKEF